MKELLIVVDRLTWMYLVFFEILVTCVTLSRDFTLKFLEIYLLLKMGGFWIIEAITILWQHEGDLGFTTLKE